MAITMTPQLTHPYLTQNYEMKTIFKNIPIEPRGEVTHPLLDKTVNWLIVSLCSASVIMIIMSLTTGDN